VLTLSAVWQLANTSFKVLITDFDPTNSPYQGCFRSTGILGQPTLNGASLLGQTALTDAICRNFCVNIAVGRPYLFFGISAGTNCYCGNTPPATVAGLPNESLCTTPNTGASNQAGGGPDAINVWRALPGALLPSSSVAVGVPSDLPPISQAIVVPSGSPSISLPISLPVSVPSGSPSISLGVSSGLPTPISLPVGVSSELPSASLPVSVSSELPSASLPISLPASVPSGSPSISLPVSIPSESPSISLPVSVPSGSPSVSLPASLPVSIPSGSPSISPPVSVPSGSPSISLPISVPSGSPSVSLPVSIPSGSPSISLGVSSSLPLAGLPAGQSQLSSLPLAVSSLSVGISSQSSGLLLSTISRQPSGSLPANIGLPSSAGLPSGIILPATSAVSSGVSVPVSSRAPTTIGTPLPAQTPVSNALALNFNADPLGQYIGCISPTGLNGMPMFDGPSSFSVSFTQRTCRLFCEAQPAGPYIFYALEQGNLCHCSRTLVTVNLVLDLGGCNMAAQGDPTRTQAGGGFGRAIVYRDLSSIPVRPIFTIVCLSLAPHKFVRFKLSMLLCLRFGPNQYSEKEVVSPWVWDTDRHQMQHNSINMVIESRLRADQHNASNRGLGFESTLTAAKYSPHLYLNF
jgi:hypothetical protein